MKIITLNIWGGLAGKEKILDFLATHQDEIDVFCLQEVWSGPYQHLLGREMGGKVFDDEKTMIYGMQEMSELLSGYHGYFCPHHLDNYGIMSFAKKSLEILEEGEVFVHKHKGFIPEGDVGHHARNIHWVKIRSNGKLITVANFHGLWNGMGKGDSEDRLEQSKKIIDFLKTLEGEIVLCGDFNLSAGTQSLKMLEDFGLRNLIREYGVTSTRTSYYQKPEKLADYIFVSRGLDVKDFRVLPDEISDHSPLYLEVE